MKYFQILFLISLPLLSFAQDWEVQAFDTLQQHFNFQDTCGDISTTIQLDSRCGAGATQAILTTVGPATDYDYIWQDSSFSGSIVDGLFYGEYPITISDGNCHYEDMVVNHELNNLVPIKRELLKNDVDYLNSFIIDANDHIITLNTSETENDGRDVSIVKLNTLGDTLWRISIGGSGDESGTAITQGFDGMIWVGARIGINDGDFSHLAEDVDRVIIKLNPDGQLLFAKPFTDFDDLVFRSDGGFFQVSQGDQNAPMNYGKCDVIVRNFSADVEQLWSQNYGGSSDDRLVSAVLSADDKLTVLATTRSDDHDLEKPLADGGKGAVWLFQLDDNGALLWQKLYGYTSSTYASKLLPVEDGTFLVSGRAQQFNSEINPWVNNANSNGFLLRLSANGELIDFSNRPPLQVARTPDLLRTTNDGNFWLRLETESVYLFNNDLQPVEGFKFTFNGWFRDFRMLSSGQMLALNRLSGSDQELVLLQPNLFEAEDILKDTFICLGEDLIIDLTGKLCNGCIPDWGDGDSSKIKRFSIHKDTTIYLQFLTEDSCRGFDQFTVGVSDLKSYIHVKESPHCNTEDGELLASFINVSGNEMSYLWSTGDTTRTITDLNIGHYSLTLTDGICVDSAETNLEIGYERKESFSRFLEHYDLDTCLRNRIIYDVDWTTDGGFLVLEKFDNNFLTKFDSLNNEVFQIGIPGTNWSTNSIIETETHYLLMEKRELYRFTKEGQLLQTYKLYENFNDFYATKILQNPDGGFFLIGYAYYPNSDPFPYKRKNMGTIIRVDEDFNLIWKKQFGGEGDDRFLDGELTAIGNLLLTGFSTSTKGDLSFNHGKKDAWLVKLNNNGELIFSKTYGSSEDDKMPTLTVAGDSIFVLIDQGAEDGSFVGDEFGAYLYCFNSNGFPLWKRPLIYYHSGTMYEGLDIEIVLGKEIYVATGKYLEDLHLLAFDFSGKDLNITEDIVRLGNYGGMSFNKEGDMLSGQGRFYGNGACVYLSTSYLLRFNYLTPSGENPFPDELFLCNDEKQFLDASRGEASYLWSTGETTPSMEVDTEGTYWVEIVISPMCIYSDTFDVILSPGTINDPVVADTIFDCGSITLDIGNSNPDVFWSHGVLGTTAEINRPGNYQFLIKDSLGCSLLDSFYFDNSGDLLLEFETKPESCEGTKDGQVVLSAQNGTPPFQYSFYLHSGSPIRADSIANLFAGTYWIAVQDEQGCLLETPIEIGTAPPMQSSYHVEQNPITLETYLYIDMVGGTPPYVVDWSFGNPFNDFLDSIQITEDGIYYAEQVTDANGCIHFPSDSIFISITSLEEPFATQNSIRLFPNPAQQELFIQSDFPLASNTTIAIYDVYGRRQNIKVLSQGFQRSKEIHRINLSHLSSGTYWLQLQAPGKNPPIFKVIVQGK